MRGNALRGQLGDLLYLNGITLARCYHPVRQSSSLGALKEFCAKTIWQNFHRHLCERPMLTLYLLQH